MAIRVTAILRGMKEISCWLGIGRQYLSELCSGGMLIIDECECVAETLLAWATPESAELYVSRSRCTPYPTLWPSVWACAIGAMHCISAKNASVKYRNVCPMSEF